MDGNVTTATDVNALSKSKPNEWIAGALGFFSPWLAMLYARRPWVSLLTFIVQSTVLLVVLIQYVAVLQGTSFTWLVLAMNCVFAIAAFAIATAAKPTVRPWYSRWYALVGFLLVIYVITFLARSFFYEPFHVPSQSMYPTVPEGSYLFVEKQGFGHYSTFGIRIFETEPTVEVSRGDMIIFDLPQDRTIRYLKRVIGLPGDRIVYSNNRLTINGREVKTAVERVEGDSAYGTEEIAGQSYLVAWLDEHPPTDFEVVVPANEYFTLGDNRNNARDSRFIGTVPRDHIVGRVAKVFRPADSASR